MDIKDFVMNQPEFKEIFDFSVVEPKFVNKIQKMKKNYSIKVFASNTCQYCKIYIPELLKIHEKVNFNLDFVVWEEYTEEQSFDIMDEFKLTGLPTFIFYNSKNKEIGRIVKEPHKSLAEDILEILNS